ncbi:MAG TPA: BTAD domain-containing putative transcriptional regulator, partial [Gaiellaceae bacterium]|nr:BTAD domain-containing putative transcriptional regulator [Gaiellaceae bacterium]
MEFGILGPLVVRMDGREVSIGSAKQRAALVVLLLRRGEVVPVETLVELLWNARPPARAVDALRVHVSQLRKLLDPGTIETKQAGYLLHVAPEAIDAEQFERLAAQARVRLVGGEPDQAVSEARRALELWRGPPLLEFRHEAFARDESARLEELRVAALECLLEAELVLGRHVETLPEVEALVREHPLRENLRRLQMLALYRAGRQADALTAFQEARRLLTAELGLEPGEPLRRLEREILRHEPTLEAAPVRPVESRANPKRLGRGGRRIALFACLAAAAVAGAVTLFMQSGGSPRTLVVSNAVAIIPPKARRTSETIPLAVAPEAITAGAGSLWVVGTDSRTVSRIDSVKGTVIQTFRVGNGPTGIVFAAGQIWVTNGLDGTVTRIDPVTDTIVQRAIPVGNSPAGIASGFGRIWVANSADGTVTPIDEDTGRPTRPIPVGQGADGIATGAGSVWVTSSASGALTRIDPHSGAASGSVTTGAGAGAVTVAYGSVWVANSLDSTVARVDPNTLAALAVIPTGDGPEGIVASDGLIWTTDQFAGTLTRIDPGSDAPGHTLATGGRPQGLAAGPQGLAVAILSSGGGHRGGTLRVLAALHRSLSFDPALTGGTLGSEIATLTNDGLTAFRKVGGSTGSELVPDLAVSLPEPTDGGRSYSFRLRPGLHYSTGAPVRPGDIRRAIERSIQLNQGTWTSQYYAADIVGAKACVAAPKKACDLSRGIVTDPSTDTVTFHLVAPDPDFLFKLALPAAYAVPAGTPLHPRGFVPATGPYQIASLSPGREVRLVRNPSFREWSPAAQPAGFPDVIDVRSYSSDRVAASAALAGHDDLAWLYSSPPSLLSTLLTQHPGQLAVDPWDITFSLVLNTRLPPFDDVRVRKALNFAVDRRKLRNLTIGPGLGQLACQILPPDFPGYQPYCPYTAHPTAGGAWSAPDLARARRLVRASRTAGEAITVWMPPWLS